MKRLPPTVPIRTAEQREQDHLIQQIRAVAFGLRQGELSTRDAAIMLYSLTDIPYTARVTRRHD